MGPKVFTFTTFDVIHYPCGCIEYQSVVVELTDNKIVAKERQAQNDEWDYCEEHSKYLNKE